MGTIGSFSDAQLGACITPRFQELILLPTEKCNFRCTYCYEDFELGRMPETVQLGIQNLILSRAEALERLLLSWFGGEPLVAKSVVLRISRFAHELSQKHGFELKGGLTTNGYLLTREVASELISVGQDFFQISLDGWKEGHDLTRRRADGAGTFDRIWTNLLDLRNSEYEFDCLLRLHLTTKNYDSMSLLCAQIQHEFGQDPRFRTNFQDIKDLGGVGGQSVDRMDSRTFVERVAALTDHLVDGKPAGTIFARPVVGGSESAGGQRAESISEEPYVCYAAKPNSLLIRSDGRVGKCTVALDDPRNDVGRLNADGTVELSLEKIRPWMRGFKSLSESELACPLDRLPQWAVQDVLGREVSGSTNARVIPMSILH